MVSLLETIVANDPTKDIIELIKDENKANREHELALMDKLNNLFQTTPVAPPPPSQIVPLQPNNPYTFYTNSLLNNTNLSLA